MERCLCYVTLCLLGLGFLETNAFEVEIKDASNKTCIFASMKVKFTVEYETNNGTFRNVTFTAPDSVTTEGSRCGNSTEPPLLNVNFGKGQSWSLNFTSDAEEYRFSFLSFTYNTSDSTLFPEAKPKGLLTSATNTGIFVPVPLNAAYKCSHDDTLITEHVVQLYWNVTLQAYMENSALGRDFRCSADLVPSTPSAPTTPLPTTHNTTTPLPTTHNATTPLPTTHNTTTPSTTAIPKPTSKPTPKPTPKPVDKPAVGNYSVSNGSETCLLASMGLQLNASLLVEGKNVWTAIDINPNTTVSSGNCGNETALLRLTDNTTTVIEFYFIIKQKNFHLQEVNVTLINGSGISYRTKVNLSLWEASSTNSYLCHKEQLITVSEDLYINTFDVRVQPFNVHNGTYAAAEDCFADQNFTVPIVVGAALGALVILVIVAYFIGRRNRRSAGYEHF
ncbi:PREDICTED: lysosome-associated membrane glycoprotein 2 [Nanorana parkeri]|uniref:lysosome-associated membrane glycoprotein 2 n=1 Tax=Nanorana parkeri TaxID=125878 RepID=UPI0008545523|nr:PREDICTED: lysosome-associated membrane glycoprotein 2 [Nanorana parkeri]